jgi:hypothetical protein
VLQDLLVFKESQELLASKVNKEPLVFKAILVPQVPQEPLEFKVLLA